MRLIRLTGMDLYTFIGQAIARQQGWPNGASIHVVLGVQIDGNGHPTTDKDGWPTFTAEVSLNESAPSADTTKESGLT